MEIELLPFFSCDGKKIQLNEIISVNALKDDDFEICSPVEFTGTVQSLGGTVEIVGTGKVSLKMTCDRCAEDFETSLEFSVNEAYKKSEDNFDNSSSASENPDITYIDNTCIDLSDILYTNMYVNIPSKHLCSLDCKGLCSVCGTNLNKKECTCNEDVTDPRFDILDSLLKD